jgi:hypothetical protein
MRDSFRDLGSTLSIRLVITGEHICKENSIHNQFLLHFSGFSGEKETKTTDNVESLKDDVA